MTHEEWLQANNEYLSASLQWMRALLKSVAAGPASAMPTAVAPAMAGRFGSAPTETGTPASQPVPDNAPGSRDLQGSAVERDSAAAISPPPALALLAQAFGLTSFERDVLLMCAAAELDPALPALCENAQGAGRTSPTFGLALNTLDEASWESLSPHRPLRHARLLEISQPGATPLTAAALRIDERILNFIKGLNALDERVALLVTEMPEALPQIAVSQDAAVDAILNAPGMQGQLGLKPVVHLVGPDSASKLTVAQHACFKLNRRLFRLGLDALPGHRADAETFARLWQRESLLLSVALYVAADDLEAAPADVAASLQGLLSRNIGPLFVSLRDPSRRSPAGTVNVTVTKPTPKEQFDTWQHSLPTVVPDTEVVPLAQRLAGQFNLDLDDISGCIAAVSAGKSGDAPARIWSRCCELLLPQLDLLAQRLEPKAVWDDLVLPDESLGLLRQIVGQAAQRYSVYQDWGFASRMNRGLGFSALFCGESGTGKTMAAEVIASELGLSLYRIDLSAVVSKYNGDTERNLRKLFDAAEQGGAILFFDEADALFGKRSEVKDSHDRYANIEINYLLQRMESFTGLAILATNMKSALDQAFLRRLRFVVNFQFPGQVERKRIWQKALPEAIRAEGLDFDRLARFNLSGGNIQSIVLNAAFSAANRRSQLTMPIMLAATRVELRKLERPVNEGDFRVTETPRSVS